MFCQGKKLASLYFLTTGAVLFSCFLFGNFKIVKAQACTKTILGSPIILSCPSGYMRTIYDGYTNCDCTSDPNGTSPSTVYSCVNCSNGFFSSFTTMPVDPDWLCQPMCWQFIVHLTDDSSCVSHLCRCYTVNSGVCGGGGGGGGSCTNTTCSVQNMRVDYQGRDYSCNMYPGVEDLTVTIGDTFSLKYEYYGTGPVYKYEKRTLARKPASGGTFTQLNCINNLDSPDCAWNDHTYPVLSCPSTPGVYDYYVNCQGAENSGESCLSDLTGSFRCRVKCEAPVISQGFIKVYHSALGYLKLNLISVADAKNKGNGLVKVAKTPVNIVAADLVDPGSPGASPVRIKTPLGIKAWKLAPP